MSKELKPCPFSGSPAEWLCNLRDAKGIDETERLRVDLEKANARVAELEAENAKLKAAQEWISVEDKLPKEDYVESGATYDLVVQYVNQPAFVMVANYYNKLWCDPCRDDWESIPNEFAKFWRERPLPPY